MILGDKTNCSQELSASRNRQRLNERFHKYKSMIQTTQAQPAENRYDDIFSTLKYISIVDKCAQKCTQKSPQSSTTNVQSSFYLSDSEPDESSVQQPPSYFDHVSLLIPSIMQVTQQENMQKPAFIRQFNLLNSSMPNYHHPQFSMKTQMKNLIIIIKSALTAINYVFGCALRMKNKNKEIKVFSTSNHCKFTLNFFLNSGWEKVKIDPYLLALKPTQNFKVDQPFQKILYQLDLLLSKTTRYELAVSLTQTMGLDLYLNIRQNLIQIEQKLLDCSHSIYVLGIKHQYPDFYYTYLQVLRSTSACLSPQEVGYIANQFRGLWVIQQPVTCSEIGRLVWNKLNILYKL